MDNAIPTLLQAISHTNDIVGVSYYIIHLEWMLMMEWVGYVAVNWSNYSVIITNVDALKH